MIIEEKTFAVLMAYAVWKKRNSWGGKFDFATPPFYTPKIR